MANNTEDVPYEDKPFFEQKAEVDAILKDINTPIDDNTEDVELRDNLRDTLNLCPKENNCHLDEGRLDRTVLLIQQEATRQKAEMLDRLEESKVIYHYQRNVGEGFFKAIPILAIESERKQLERNE